MQHFGALEAANNGRTLAWGRLLQINAGLHRERIGRQFLVADVLSLDKRQCGRNVVSCTRSAGRGDLDVVDRFRLRSLSVDAYTEDAEREKATEPVMMVTYQLSTSELML